MVFRNSPRNLQVLAVSDLHLFAYRSVGAKCFDSIRPQLATTDVLVLNGDIFDFRWSTLPDLQTTVTASIAWLDEVAKISPRLEVHYVLGNHDCQTFFRASLATLAETRPNFRWHEQGVRIGSAVFLHGDCTHRKMDPAGLERHRKAWDNQFQHRLWRAHAYVAADYLGLTWATHRGYFPRWETVGRVAHYLDQASADWRQTTRDCYFGHTHLPFSNYIRDGIAFHNTGSAIRGMDFNPIAFGVSADRVESLEFEG